MSSAIAKSMETNSNTPDIAVKDEMRDGTQANTSYIKELEEIMKKFYSNSQVRFSIKRSDLSNIFIH